MSNTPEPLTTLNLLKVSGIKLTWHTKLHIWEILALSYTCSLWLFVAFIRLSVLCHRVKLPLGENAQHISLRDKTCLLYFEFVLLFQVFPMKWEQKCLPKYFAQRVSLSTLTFDCHLKKKMAALSILYEQRTGHLKLWIVLFVHMHENEHVCPVNAEQRFCRYMASMVIHALSAIGH